MAEHCDSSGTTFCHHILNFGIWLALLQSLSQHYVLPLLGKKVAEGCVSKTMLETAITVTAL